MSNIFFAWCAKHKNTLILFIIACTVLDVILWWQIFHTHTFDETLRLYFLNVGQGDAVFAILPGGVKLLVDGGPPNGRLLRELEKILPSTDRYIDLVMMSHPQLDHFGGFIEFLKRYHVGAFLSTGRKGEISAFYTLENIISENNIRTIHLMQGDFIRYRESVGEIIHPNKKFLISKELNDASLVMKLTSASSTILFTGDIGANIEDILHTIGFIDILKVAHHGSRFSSTVNFLKMMQPKIAMIEVGKNSYGHPTQQILSNIQNVGARLYRTDKDGTVEIISNGKTLKILKNFSFSK